MSNVSINNEPMNNEPMNNEPMNNLKEKLDYLQSLNDAPLEADENKILASYENEGTPPSPLIRSISIISGIMASGLILVSVYLLDPDLALILGIIAYLGSLRLSRQHTSMQYETLTAMLVFYGTVQITLSYFISYGYDMYIILFALSALSLFVSRSFNTTFLAIIGIYCSCVAYVMLTAQFNLGLLQISSMFLGLLMGYLILYEGKLIALSKNIGQRYSAFKSGTTFAFILSLFVGLIVGGANQVVYPSSTLIIILAVIYLVSKMVIKLGITSKAQRFSIYLFCLLILLPSIHYMPIAGSLLILLLGIYINAKYLIGLGVVSLISFISYYYYILNVTLLTKSIILFASGMLFMLFYLLTYKKWGSYEKN